MPHSISPEPQPTVGRVDGWTRYYEYFHKLNEHMQQTAELSAQRRSRLEDPSLPALKPVPVRDHSCFESIAELIREHDKPLVHIEDGESGQEKESLGQGRTLTETDLRLVHAQLRTAAHASNLRAAVAREAEQRELGDLTAATGEVKKETNADGKPNHAAAMETLVWFGLALGEQPPRTSDTKAAGSSSLEVEQMSKCFEEYERALDAPAGDEVIVGSLGGWDWMAAMADAGLREGDGKPVGDFEHSTTMPPLERFDSDTPSETASSERFDWDAASEGSGGDASGTGEIAAMCETGTWCDGFGPTMAEMDSSLQDEPATGAEEAQQEQEQQQQHHMQQLQVQRQRRQQQQQQAEVGEDVTPADTGSPYQSPSRESQVARSRSGRQMKPKRSLLEVMEQPLLKWEKERSQKKRPVPKSASTDRQVRSRGASRESSAGSSAGSVGSQSREGLYDTDTGDTSVEDDALLDQLGPLCAFAMTSDEGTLAMSAKLQAVEQS